jgi:hypothetical protein
MEQSLATQEIRNFLDRLGRHYPQPVKLYLLGGSALCFLGNPRRTVDIDCSVDRPTEEFQEMVEAVANGMQVEVEIIPIDAFIPLPPYAKERHQNIGRFGSIEAYIFDPYSIAISKIARGFETDIQDVLFLLNQGIIELEILSKFLDDSYPLAWDYDIDPNDLRTHFEVVETLAHSKPGLFAFY